MSVVKPWLALPRALGWTLVLLAATAAAQGADAGGEKAGEVAATVRLANGRPAIGATCDLFRFDGDWRQWIAVGATREVDASGTVTFDHLPVESHLLVVRASDGMLGLKDYTLLDDNPRQAGDITLHNRAAIVLHLRNSAGKPVMGAAVGSIYLTSDNGSVFLPAASLKGLGLSAEVSDERGELRLPALPEGGRANVKVLHAVQSPVFVQDLPLESGNATRVEMLPGVPLTFRVRPAESASVAGKLMIDLRKRLNDDASMLTGNHVYLDADGIGRLTVSAGDYYWVRLRHPDFLVTPIYRRGRANDAPWIPVAPGRDEFVFDIHPKVIVRGRVIDESTGKPLAKANVGGEVAATGAGGSFAEFCEPWTHAGWAETDAAGQYEIKLSSGRARVSLSVEGYVEREDYVELNVASDGSTIAPDLVTGPLPTTRGIVTTPDGQPIAGAIVRFPGALMNGTKPVLTDAAGRFELKAEWMPTDYATSERRPLQLITATHPHELLAARREIKLNEPATLADIRLVLEPKPADQWLADIAAGLGDWERGVAKDDLLAKARSKSPLGQTLPELDGAHWLNTDGASMQLADFRGKYVLLDFWTTWCGPCHADFPSVRMLYDVYKDHGVVVIGVHDNSMPLEAIQQDVLKERLTFPIVVDHPDGRIIDAYRKCGLIGFPTYFLIDPDGKVVRDDHLPGPSLRSYKLEIVRQLLLEK